MKLAGIALLLLTSTAQAAGLPYGLLDIPLGSSYAHLKQVLDLRDINSALAALGAPGRPDLGRRGYGCMLREDEFADMGCVSHDDRLDGIPTREIRLQFIAGRLQQMSLTAEVQYADAVVDYLRQRYGRPVAVMDPSPRYVWHNATSNLYAIRGQSLVFVSLELASYQTAVSRKRRQGNSAPECR